MRGEGVAQQEQSDPSSRDLPMIEANPADPMDPMVIEEPVDQSSLRVINVSCSAPRLIVLSLKRPLSLLWSQSP